MIEPDESMLLDSAYTDDELRFILDEYGPVVKDGFLVPKADDA